MLVDDESDVFNISRRVIRVATIDGAIAGYVFYRVTKVWGIAGMCMVFDISVDPRYRRAGVGRALLDDIIGREPKVDTVMAMIWPGNTASRMLFETFCFRLEPDRRRPYLNAYKTKEVAFRHRPLIALTPLFVVLYAMAVGLAEMAVLRLRQKPS